MKSISESSGVGTISRWRFGVISLGLLTYLLLASSCIYIGWHPTTHLDTETQTPRSREAPLDAYVLLPKPTTCPNTCNRGQTCRSLCIGRQNLAYDLDLVNEQFRDILINRSHLVELPTSGDSGAKIHTIQVSIALHPPELTPLSVVPVILSGITLTLLPTYNDSAEYVVRYDVIVQGETKRRYSYVVRQRQLLWLFGLFAAPWWDMDWTIESFPRPIDKYGRLAMWIRIASEKIGGTANMFLQDARRDGVLAP